ncbi:MAG: prepilin-type N-terminal cleavage/methylation domain-containing protein [Gemmatimonadaceae bacterium]
MALHHDAVALLPGPGGVRRRGTVRRAFTLIEVLAAMTIVAALTALSIPRFKDAIDLAKNARAEDDVRTIETELDGQDTLPDNLSGIGRAGMLDPWGHPYVYYKFPPSKGGGRAPPSGARKDRFLVPVNSTYDLYSMGADGQTAIAFTAKAARDDIVRANDGSYVGPAAKF